MNLTEEMIQSLSLPSNPIKILTLLHEEEGEPEENGAARFFPNNFYLYRPFKLVADLSRRAGQVLAPKVTAEIMLRDYYEPGASGERESANFIDGSLVKTQLYGFGTYSRSVMVALPSHNPDPRIRIPIPGEHVRDGERLFEAAVTTERLDLLHEMGYCDSEAPILIHGIVERVKWAGLSILVTNTGVDDFALADIAQLTFQAEMYHDIPSRGYPYNRTMLRSYFVHRVTTPEQITSDEDSDMEEDDV